MANVRKLMRLATEYEEHEGRNLRGFLEFAEERTVRDEREGMAAVQVEGHDGVRVMTVHAAKGLEFAVVFIVGLEDGLLPLHWSEPDDAATAEERRLFYVGMTRAKDRLILSRARQRHWRGRTHMLEPSPFLRDIENELVKHQPMQGGRGKREDRQLKLF